MAKLNGTPDGLKLTDASSSLRGSDETISYQFPEAESIDDIRAAYADAGNQLGREYDPEEILVGLFNAAQRAAASNLVLGAMRDEDGDVDSAVTEAATILVQTGRVGGGGGARGKVTAGLNKTRQAEFGAEFVKRTAEKGAPLTKAEIEALSKEFGLNPNG